MERQSAASITSDQYSSQYDKLNLSRRSVDWRDSGIVIDDDHSHFSSSEPLYDPTSQSSFLSSAASIHSQLEGQFPSSTLSTTSSSSSCCPSQRIAYDQDDDGDTMLHLAVVGFDIRKVRDLVKICQIDANNNMLQTAMHVAVLANRPEMVNLLIESGARLDVHDRRGNTPLHLACQKGHLEIVEIILDSFKQNPQKQQQQIEKTNFDGQTCLHLASTSDRRELIELLVNKYNANINCKDSKSGETIMHKAICKFNLDLVAFILRLAKHCNTTDYSGRTPLDTIRILKDSRVNDSQMEILKEINLMVLQRIASCQADCCVEFKKQLQNQNEREILDSSSETSSSNSDYSDSDYEMN